MVEAYKDISMWYDPTHGGEHRVHSDFTMEADEDFASALAELFKDFTSLPPEGREGGGQKKCHLNMSIYEESIKERDK